MMKKALMLLPVALLVRAAAPDTKEIPPGHLLITANTFEYDGTTRIVVYQGDVTVIDPPSKPGEPETRLTCQTLTVKLPEGGGRIETIQAEGEVVIEQGVNTATGAKALYRAETDVVELTGNPVLTTAQGVLRGTLVVLDRKNNKLRAFGNQVRMELRQDAVGKPAEGLLDVKPKSKPDGKTKL